MENYKNASVIMTGLACLLMISDLIVRIVTNDFMLEPRVWYVLGPIKSLATPILFAWIGVLLRSRYPYPKQWVKWILLAIIPGLYFMWTILHKNGIYCYGDGERCIWLYSAILGYMIPVEQLKRSATNDGWLELVLFLASAFCYCGITRVENHFSVVNFQMLTGEWTRLFCRMMRFVPLAMSLYFLIGFSFTRVGQAIGSKKAVGRSAQVIACISFLVVLFWTYTWFRSFFTLYKTYRLLSQPVMVYLICLLWRVVRHGLNGLKGKKDLFMADE